jgi:hypothetical protein
MVGTVFWIASCATSGSSIGGSGVATAFVVTTTTRAITTTTAKSRSISIVHSHHRPSVLHYRPSKSYSQTHHQRLQMMASTDNAGGKSDESEDENDDSEAVVVDEVIISNGSTVQMLDGVPKWKRIVFFYKYGTKKADDGLTFRQKLTKAGLSVVLSYGFVSNMSYCVSVSAAWYIFCKRTQLSPLAPGQWKPFLAVYSGFWVFNNVVRPVRFGASVALSTQFDKIVQWIQTKTRLSKGASIGLVVFLANIVGTTVIMCTGIAFAASLAGVPIRP